MLQFEPNPEVTGSNEQGMERLGKLPQYGEQLDVLSRADLEALPNPIPWDKMPGIPQHTRWWLAARSQFVINASSAGPLAGLADIRPRTYAEGDKNLPRGERRTLRQKTCVNAFPLFNGMMGTGPHLASTFF